MPPQVKDEVEKLLDQLLDSIYEDDDDDDDDEEFVDCNDDDCADMADDVSYSPCPTQVSI